MRHSLIFIQSPQKNEFVKIWANVWLEKNEKPVPKTPEERSETEEIILDNFCGCCSSSDCTGLIPSDPTSETAADEYRNVYPYAVPDSDGVPYTKNKKKTYGKEGTHGGV